MSGGVSQLDGRGVDALVFPAQVGEDVERGRLVEEREIAG